MRLIQNNNKKLMNPNIEGLEYNLVTSELFMYSANTIIAKKPLTTPIISTRLISSTIYPLFCFFKIVASLIVMNSEYLFKKAKLRNINVEKAINQNDNETAITSLPANTLIEYNIASRNTSYNTIFLKNNE